MKYALFCPHRGGYITGINGPTHTFFASPNDLWHYLSTHRYTNINPTALSRSKS